MNSRAHITFLRESAGAAMAFADRIEDEEAEADRVMRARIAGWLAQTRAQLGLPPTEQPEQTDSPHSAVAGATREVARGPWFVLRDPVTAPTGWVNQVKVAHATRQDAAEAADRLARSTGGRFLILEATAYVDPAPSLFHEGSPLAEVPS